LINNIADTVIDRMVKGLLDLFELAFPGRVRSAYLVGSRAAEGKLSLPAISISASSSAMTFSPASSTLLPAPPGGESDLLAGDRLPAAQRSALAD